jgi:site-specific recombinase XerD
VLRTATTWRELVAARVDAGGDDPVFRSQKGGSLSPVQVWRIVRAAARRAGIAGDVSPHWLRHAHASHPLDRGAPIHLVQATLGHADLRTTSKYTHARPNDRSARYLGI